MFYILVLVSDSNLTYKTIFNWTLKEKGHLLCDNLVYSKNYQFFKIRIHNNTLVCESNKNIKYTNRFDSKFINIVIDKLSKIKKVVYHYVVRMMKVTIVSDTLTMLSRFEAFKVLIGIHVGHQKPTPFLSSNNSTVHAKV